MRLLRSSFWSCCNISNTAFQIKEDMYKHGILAGTKTSHHKNFLSGHCRSKVIHTFSPNITGHHFPRIFYQVPPRKIKFKRYNKARHISTHNPEKQRQAPEHKTSTSKNESSFKDNKNLIGVFHESLNKLEKENNFYNSQPNSYNKMAGLGCLNNNDNETFGKLLTNKENLQYDPVLSQLAPSYMFTNFHLPSIALLMHESNNNHFDNDLKVRSESTTKLDESIPEESNKPVNELFILTNKDNPCHDCTARKIEPSVKPDRNEVLNQSSSFPNSVDSSTVIRKENIESQLLGDISRENEILGWCPSDVIWKTRSVTAEVNDSINSNKLSHQCNVKRSIKSKKRICCNTKDLVVNNEIETNKPISQHKLPYRAPHSTSILNIINSVDKSAVIIQKDLYITNRILDSMKKKKEQDDKDDKDKIKMESMSIPEQSNSILKDISNENNLIEQGRDLLLPLVPMEPKDSITFNKVPSNSPNSFKQIRQSHSDDSAKPPKNISGTSVDVNTKTVISSTKDEHGGEISVLEVQKFVDKRLPFPFSTETVFQVFGSNEKLNDALTMIEKSKIKLAILNHGDLQNKLGIESLENLKGKTVPTKSTDDKKHETSIIIPIETFTPKPEPNDESLQLFTNPTIEDKQSKHNELIKLARTINANNKNMKISYAKFDKAKRIPIKKGPGRLRKGMPKLSLDNAKRTFKENGENVKIISAKQIDMILGINSKVKVKTKGDAIKRSDKKRTHKVVVKSKETLPKEMSGGNETPKRMKTKITESNDPWYGNKEENKPIIELKPLVTNIQTEMKNVNKPESVKILKQSENKEEPDGEGLSVRDRIILKEIIGGKYNFRTNSSEIPSTPVTPTSEKVTKSLNSKKKDSEPGLSKSSNSKASSEGKSEEKTITLKSSDKKSSNSSDKTLVKSSAKSLAKHSEKAPLKSSEKAALKNSEKAALKNSEKGALKNSEKGTLKNPEKAALKSSDKAALKSSDKAALKSSAKAAIKGPEKAALKSPDKTTIKNPEKATLNTSDKVTLKSSDVMLKNNPKETAGSSYTNSIDSSHSSTGAKPIGINKPEVRFIKGDKLLKEEAQRQYNENISKKLIDQIKQEHSEPPVFSHRGAEEKREKEISKIANKSGKEISSQSSKECKDSQQSVEINQSVSPDAKEINPEVPSTTKISNKPEDNKNLKDKIKFSQVEFDFELEPIKEIKSKPLRKSSKSGANIINKFKENDDILYNQIGQPIENNPINRLIARINSSNFQTVKDNTIDKGDLHFLKRTDSKNINVAKQENFWNSDKHLEEQNKNRSFGKEALHTNLETKEHNFHTENRRHKMIINIGPDPETPTDYSFGRRSIINDYVPNKVGTINSSRSQAHKTLPSKRIFHPENEISKSKQQFLKKDEVYFREGTSIKLKAKQLRATKYHNESAKPNIPVNINSEPTVDLSIKTLNKKWVNNNYVENPSAPVDVQFSEADSTLHSKEIVSNKSVSTLKDQSSSLKDDDFDISKESLFHEIKHDHKPIIRVKKQLKNDSSNETKSSSANKLVSESQKYKNLNIKERLSSQSLIDNARLGKKEYIEIPSQCIESHKVQEQHDRIASLKENPVRRSNSHSRINESEFKIEEIEDKKSPLRDRARSKFSTHASPRSRSQTIQKRIGESTSKNNLRHSRLNLIKFDENLEEESFRKLIKDRVIEKMGLDNKVQPETKLSSTKEESHGEKRNAIASAGINLPDQSENQPIPSNIQRNSNLDISQPEETPTITPKSTPSSMYDVPFDVVKIDKEIDPPLDGTCKVCAAPLHRIMEFPMINPKRKQFYEVGNQGILSISIIPKTKKDPKVIPSVTTVLNLTMGDSSKSALTRWRVGMVNQLGEDGFKQFYKEQLQKGTEFHETVQRYLRSFPSSLTNFAIGSTNLCFQSVKGILKNITEVTVLESQVIHPALAYRGIIDCVAKYRNVPVIIEWKRSDKPKPTVRHTFDAPLQLSAYVGALNYDDSYNMQVEGALVVIAYSDGTPADVFSVNLEECKYYWKQWLERYKRFVSNRNSFSL